jgi:hypothetical protein
MFTRMGSHPPMIRLCRSVCRRTRIKNISGLYHLQVILAQREFARWTDCSMWPDAVRRVSAIRERADVFREQKFERTSRLLRKLAVDVERGRRNVPHKVFMKLLLTYGEEYSVDVDYAWLFEFVSGVLLKSLDTLGSKIAEAGPLLRNMNKSATVLEQISKVCLRSGPLSKEELYYVTCVLHALDAEGPFDQACRLLYFLYKNSHKQPISLSDAERIELRDLRNNLGRLTKGASKILFVGWNDRHLRNAIAHVWLEYDAKSNSMTFRDRRHAQTLPWPKFKKYYHLTRGASSVFLHVMLLLEARDLAFAANPFDKPS